MSDSPPTATALKDLVKTGRPPAAPESGLWPGTDDPVTLLRAVADWLAGYGNRATRRTYAESLGLPVSPAGITDWADHQQAPPGWVEALTEYVTAVTTPAKTPVATRRPPARRPGPLRDLHWFRWCAHQDIDPLAATSAEVKRWLGHLDDAGAAPATRDRMLATLKTLYTHLAETGLVTANPAALNRRRLGLTTPPDATTTVVLTIGQVRALLATAATPRPGASPVDTARAHAVLALFTLGLRVTELCDLDRADLHVTRGRRALRVRGKGGKTRVVYLHTTAETALTDYLRLHATATPTDATPARRGNVNAAHSPLLINRLGNRYTRQALWQLLRRVTTAAGEALTDLATVMHPHALRHFYVTTAVEAGAQLTHIQADVGHTSVDTTQNVYNHAARHPDHSATDLIGAVLTTAPQPTDTAPDATC